MTVSEINPIGTEEPCPFKVKGVTVAPWDHGYPSFLKNDNSAEVGKKLSNTGVEFIAVDGLLPELFYRFDFPTCTADLSLILEGTNLNTSFGQLLQNSGDIQCYACDAQAYWTKDYSRKYSEATVGLAGAGTLISIVAGISEIGKGRKEPITRRSFLEKAKMGGLFAAAGAFILAGGNLVSKFVAQTNAREAEYERVAACRYKEPPLDGMNDLVSLRNGNTIYKMLSVINAAEADPEKFAVVFGYSHLAVDRSSFEMSLDLQQAWIAAIFNREMAVGIAKFREDHDSNALLTLEENLTKFLLSSSSLIKTRVDREEDRITITPIDHYFFPEMLTGTGFNYDLSKEDLYDTTGFQNAVNRATQIGIHVMNAFSLELEKP